MGDLKRQAVKPQDRKFNTLVGASGEMSSKMVLQLCLGPALKAGGRVVLHFITVLNVHGFLNSRKSLDNTKVAIIRLSSAWLNRGKKTRKDLDVHL